MLHGIMHGIMLDVQPAEDWDLHTRNVRVIVVADNDSPDVRG